MLPSRTKTPARHQHNPRHTPRTVPQASKTFAPHMPSMTHPNYAIVTGAPELFPELASCMPDGHDAFYSGNDGSYIPTSVVAPTDLSFMHNMGSYELDVASGSISGSSTKSFSPLMTEAEILQSEVYQTANTTSGMDQFSYYSDPWMQLPPTPPAEQMFDVSDMFSTGKNDVTFETLPDSATECEYLGVSKLQFSRALPRQYQQRPLRSASERTPESSASGSPKEAPMERTKNNPRNDPRYDIKPDKNGVYHCPFAKDNCNHKPTKQKCIYAKNLDSHLKPYVCKHGASDENCKGLRFSSNACLFRHEREMHGLHNHGINPYLCNFQGCERSREDNGFPRRWNQRDHMKRVHGWEEPDNDDVADRGFNDPSRRKKVSGAPAPVTMKRTSSARAHPYLPGQQKSASAPRYSQPMSRQLQAYDIVPGMTIDPSHYAMHPMVTQSYGQGLYMTAY